MINRRRTLVAAFSRMARVFMPSTPTVPRDERVRLRARLLVGEVKEAIESCFVVDDPLHRATHGAFLTAFSALETLIEFAPVRVDLVNWARELVDIAYVVEGSFLEAGINPEPVFDRVHGANMRKSIPCGACGGAGGCGPRPGPGGFASNVFLVCRYCGGAGRAVVARSDGKVLKPSNWAPPDVAGALQEQGWTP